MPWGRGGAGNIAQIEESQKRVAEQKQDLEANQPTVEASNPPTDSPSTQKVSSPAPSNWNQDYAHTGRGGAGNWYEPKILSETGKFVASEQPTAPPPTQPDKEVIAETRHRGRGGAGNYVWSQEDEERARDEERGKEIELKEMVARDVERALPRPVRAVPKLDRVDRAFIRDWEEQA